MAIKNQALTVYYVAWNSATSSGQTGDAGNHTLRGVGDGTVFTPSGTPAEVDSVHLPGVYKLALLASETNYNGLLIGGVSSTSGVTIMPVQITTDRGVLLGSGVVLASAGLDAIAVETGINAAQAVSLILAACAGQISGAGTGSIAIKGGNVATTRIAATVDSNGNRTAVTLSPPSI